MKLGTWLLLKEMTVLSKWRKLIQKTRTIRLWLPGFLTEPGEEKMLI